MLTIFKGNLSPSVSDTITVNGTAVNLTGSTVKFRMRAAGSSTLKVDAAAVVVSAVAGTVRYDWQNIDVDTVGDYVFWWQVTLSGGDTQDTPESILIIADHAEGSNIDLCTVADVKISMEIPTGVTTLDAAIQQYITDASELIMEDTGREFAPVTAAATRRFQMNTYTGGAYRIELFPYDLRSVSAVVLHPESSSSQAVDITSDIEFRPFSNRYGVYTSLMVSPWLNPVSVHMLKFGRPYADVTGAWGFASVPAPVKRACIVTVRAWLRLDSQAGATSVGDGYGGQTLAPQIPTTYALPAAATKLLRKYRRGLYHS